MSDCYWNSGPDADCTFESTSTTPPEPGCCMIVDGSSSSNPWIVKCTEFWTEMDCITPTVDGYDPRCQWTPTPEDFDCSGIWPTEQPTEQPVPGCCAADSFWAEDRCNETGDKTECDRMSSCHWIETEDSSECEWLTTDEPQEPGCCFVEDPADIDTKWQELCTAFWTEERCLSASVCHWEPTDDYVDCEELYPTAPPTASNSGCCAGDSAEATIVCADRDSEETCDRYSMCHWIGGDDADCEWKTTEPVTEPGCCYLNGDSDSTELWTAKCIEYWNEDDCTAPEDVNGVERCIWTPTSDYVDCEDVYPTTEPPEPGCCAGIDAKTNLQCGAMETKTECERRSSCYWNLGDDADCSWPSTTPHPFEPGCCILADADNLGTRWEVMCTEFYAEFDCLKPVDAEYIRRCEWVDTPSDYDCKHLWPTRAPQGCCTGDSYLSTADCQAVGDDRNRCDRMSGCFWIETLDEDDCAWGTTQSPSDPGCCYIASPGDIGSEWEEQCNSLWTEGDCMLEKDGYGTNKCRWQSTGHYFDCSLLWPTPVPEPGCCTGDSDAAYSVCSDTMEMKQCQRMSSCHWIPTNDPSECDEDDNTEPGCCDVAGYFNPMAGWINICRSYWNEEECADPGPVGSDGVTRCQWTATDEYVDCESLWTTPPPESGCCSGEDMASNAVCVTKEDKPSCERMSSCHWIFGDYADCGWITTTEAPGCCAGDSADAAVICADRESKETCDRFSICHWLSGDDADCEWGPGYDDHDAGCCTVSDVKNPQSYLWEDRCKELWNADNCREPLDDHSNARCQWTATDGDYDCGQLWPTTPAPDTPGCCIVDESQNPEGVWTGKCALFWNERDCRTPMDGAGQYRCSWIPTDYAVDCAELMTTETPQETTENTENTESEETTENTPSPTATYPVNTWTPTEPTRFPTHPTPEPTKNDNRDNEKDGCCAADCEEELELCNGIDDSDKCQKLSSCHWKPGKKADCSWKKNNDEAQSPGCCVAKSDKVDAEWFSKCPQFWNEEKCDKKDKNCKWVDCEEEEDCTKYWPQLQFEGKVEVALFQDIQLREHEVGSKVSLLTVVVLLMAAAMMYRGYWWWSRDGGEYQKLADYKWERQSTSHSCYESM